MLTLKQPSDLWCWKHRNLSEHSSSKCQFGEWQSKLVDATVKLLEALFLNPALMGVGTKHLSESGKCLSVGSDAITQLGAIRSLSNQTHSESHNSRHGELITVHQCHASHVYILVMRSQDIFAGKILHQKCELLYFK